MPRLLRSILSCGLMISLLPVACPILAQSPVAAISIPSRIVAPIDESSRTTLHGAVHPLATKANDRGRVPDSTPLTRMQVVLKRSATQETALKQMIDDLHNPTSASFHQWLTPEQFGKQFGPSDADVAAISSWLGSKGFNVTGVNAGRQTLEFSGTAGQFRDAFHAEIHHYSVRGGLHNSIGTDPQIPSALAPVFGGFTTLNNFPLKSSARLKGPAQYTPQTGKAKAAWTVGSPAEGYDFVLAPADFAIQYDVQPLYNAGTNGTGQSIAVINISNINVYLVNQFRSLFNLPANTPQVIVDGNDPGVNGINNPDGENGWAEEAYLDVEMAGAIAPDATVYLVTAADTALSSGFYLAAEHAVYSNISPVMSLSVQECEYDNGSGNQFLSSLWEQAAAQGITVVVAASDSGSAGCDDFDTQVFAVGGQAVNGWASTPYNVAVGGTDFYYSDYAGGGTALGNQIASYWTETASNSTPVASLKSVIPEQPWNDSQFGLDAFNYYDYYSTTNIVAGGGGASTCGIPTFNSNGSIDGCTPYPKPTWQSGTGVPADKVRDLPDVSLFAADGINYSYYPICAIDGDCQTVSSGSDVQISGVGGTSASAPAFAGIMALVNQKYGRQGQANYILYPLAAQYPTAFHDVTVGTNSVPCAVTDTSDGTVPVGCIPVANELYVTDPEYGSAYEGKIGSGTTAEYNAGVGYDLASGLGSIDANVMMTDWNKVSFTGTTTTLTPSSTSFTHGTAIKVAGAVKNSGATTPSGEVALMTTSNQPNAQGQTNFALSSGSFSGSVNFLPGGTYTIYGRYSGDTANAASTSTPVSLTVTPESSATALELINENSAGETLVSSGGSITYGDVINLEALPAPTADLTSFVNCFLYGGSCPVFTAPTGTVIFTDSSRALGTLALNANGEADYEYAPAIGAHTITAAYSGDPSYSVSATTSASFTVVKDTPKLSAELITGTTTGGGQQLVQFYAENSVGLNKFPAAPTGTFTFTGFPGNSPSSVTLTSTVDPGTGVPEGVGTVLLPSTSTPGTYAISYAYSGDSNYNATSGTYGLVIPATSSLLASSTTASASASATSPSGLVTISGTVTGQSGHPAPTGVVAAAADGYEVGEAMIVTGTGSTSTFTMLVSSGTLAAGNNAINVEYTGDVNYQPSWSNTINIANPLSDFSLVTTAAAVTEASSAATDTINVNSVSGFSGAVALTCSATGGITCSLSPSSVTLATSGSVGAALTLNTTNVTTTGVYSALVTGKDSTGQYVHTLNIVINVPTITTTAGFTLAANGSGAIIIASPGGSSSASLTVTPTGTFTGAVNLTCAVTSSPSSASDLPTCAVTTPVTLAASTASSATLTVNTTAQTGVLTGEPLNWIRNAGGTVLAALVMFALLPTRRRRLPALLAILTVALVLGAAAGCGGKGTTQSGGSGASGGTTTGGYVVTVTGTDAATGKITSSAPVTVTVN